eukprot:jgi/Tetstr1/424862/TSEL_001492.t1
METARRTLRTTLEAELTDDDFMDLYFVPGIHERYEKLRDDLEELRADGIHCDYAALRGKVMIKALPAAAPPASAPELPSLQTVGLVPLPHALIINHFFGLCCGGTLSLLDGMLTAGFAVTRIEEPDALVRALIMGFPRNAVLCTSIPNNELCAALGGCVDRNLAVWFFRAVAANLCTSMPLEFLFSQSAAQSSGATFYFGPSTSTMTLPCGADVNVERMHDVGLYALHAVVTPSANVPQASARTLSSPVPVAAAAVGRSGGFAGSRAQAALLHARMGHTHHDGILRTAKLVPSLPYVIGAPPFCEVCALVKSTVAAVPRTVGSRFEHEPFAVLNLDIWGPMAPSLHGRRWMIGANCRRTNVHLAGSLVTQSEAAGAVDRFLAFARRKGFTVRQIRVDRAAVFLCSSLEKICKDANVDMQTDGADNAAVDVRQLPPLPSSPPLRRSTRIRSSTTDDSYVYYGTTKSSCPAAPAAVVDSVSLPSTLSQHDIPQKALGTRYAFRTKFLKNGYVDKRKARFVVLGNHQRPGIDFDSTKLYAPVVSFVSIRILLALAVYLRRRIYNMDVTTAFLNAKVTEEIYIKLPRGMEEFSESGEPMVGRLLRALYGLRQSPGLWFTELDNYLKRNNFRQCTSDGCVYVQLVGTDGDFAAVAIYVDDIIILEAADPAWYPAFKTRLLAEFDCTDAGLCTWLMGMGLDWDDDDGGQEYTFRFQVAE